MGAKAIWRRLAGRLKALCRFGARPILPILPACVANALPALGRVHVRIPGCPRRMSLNTYGRAGKDRIALKLGRQGVFGYEPECMQVFLRLLAKTRFFVDVGANTGLYALVATIQDPRRRVVAFEPVPEIHDMLRANVALNRLGNLTAEALAVGNQVGTTTFFVTQTGGGVATDSSAVAGFRAQVQPRQVRLVTLDHYLAERNLTGVDLLKIDAEAADVQVLQGARATLERDRPAIFCEVLEDADSSALHRVLDPLDYRAFHLAAGGLDPRPRILGHSSRVGRNYLFVGADKVAKVLPLCASSASAA